MAEDSLAFTVACEVVERLSGLTSVQARGSVRLALREAGLFDSQVTSSQLSVVARGMLVRELRAGGVADAEAVCEQVRARIAAVPDVTSDDSPDAVFARLGLVA
jgi:hypothetical protein